MEGRAAAGGIRPTAVTAVKAVTALNAVTAVRAVRVRVLKGALPQ